jgi:DNA repair photolyase
MTDAIKGRGALSQPPGRFDKLTHTLEHDGWYEEEQPEKRETIVLPENARTVISRNQSPDIHFAQSTCGDARDARTATSPQPPTSVSPGLDFETKLFYKADAAAVLEGTRCPNYKCAPIMIGANADPYQPPENLEGRSLRCSKSRFATNIL